MKVVFPGSFDPFTIGHADIVKRALNFADSIVIAVGVNDSKKSMYSVEQRVEAIALYYGDDERVTVIPYEGLTMDLVIDEGADALLRGVRSVTDFEYEQNMALVNSRLGGVETVFLYASPEYQHISSSMVRELSKFGQDTYNLVIDTFRDI